MAKRKVIKIDESKCNGCGLCVPNCPEGALQIIDGKARLISDLFCDGLGACIGHCPEGAITIEEREAEAYDEKRVMENIVRQGENVIRAHLRHLKEHGEEELAEQAVEFLAEKGIEVPRDEEEGPTGLDAGVEEAPSHGPAGCPGMRVLQFDEAPHAPARPGGVLGSSSQLRQWPIQLQLLNPSAPYFKNRDIVVCADCVPFAYPDFHERFLKGKTLIIFCPKLDKVLDMYLDKLTAILSSNEVKLVTLLHMEVPCCYGLVTLVEEAVKRSGESIILKDYVISIRGEIT